MTLVVRAIFLENEKYHPQIFLDEYLYKIYIKKNKNKLKEIDIKINCMCYYFDDIIRDFDSNFDNILLDEKLYENISVYDISYNVNESKTDGC